MGDNPFLQGLLKEKPGTTAASDDSDIKDLYEEYGVEDSDISDLYKEYGIDGPIKAIPGLHEPKLPDFTEKRPFTPSALLKDPIKQFKYDNPEVKETDALEIAKINAHQAKINEWESKNYFQKSANYIGDIGERLAAGIYDMGSMAMKTPEMIQDIANLPYNIIMKSGLKNAAEKNGMTPEQIAELFKAYDETWVQPGFAGQFTVGKNRSLNNSSVNKKLEGWRDQLRNNSNRLDENTIQGYFKEGEYGKAVAKTVLGAVESLPITLAAAFTGTGGLVGIGVLTASGQYDDLNETHPGMSDPLKVANSVLYGVSETMTEIWGTKQIADMVRLSIKTAGKEVAEKQVKTGLSKVIQDTYKTAGLWIAPVHEGTSEWVNQVSQNAIAIATGEDPNRKLTEGAFDAFAIGTLTGTGFTAVGELSKNTAKNRVQEQTIREAETQLQKVLHKKDGSVTTAMNGESPVYVIDNVDDKNVIIYDEATGKAEMISRAILTDIESVNPEQYRAEFINTALQAKTEQNILKAAEEVLTEQQQNQQAATESLKKGNVITFQGQELVVTDLGQETFLGVPQGGDPVADAIEVPIQEYISQFGQDMSKNDMPESDLSTSDNISQVQPEPKTGTLGNTQIIYNENPDGTFSIPIKEGDDSKKLIKQVESEIDTEAFEVVPVTQEIPIEDAAPFAKTKTRVVTTGINIVPKKTPTDETVKEHPGTPKAANIKKDNIPEAGTEENLTEEEVTPANINAKAKTVLTADEVKYDTKLPVYVHSIKDEKGKEIGTVEFTKDKKDWSVKNITGEVDENSVVSGLKTLAGEGIEVSNEFVKPKETPKTEAKPDDVLTSAITKLKDSESFNDLLGKISPDEWAAINKKYNPGNKLSQQETYEVAINDNLSGKEEVKPKETKPVKTEVAKPAKKISAKDQAIIDAKNKEIQAKINRKEAAKNRAVPKRIQDVLSRDPMSIDEAILQFFVRGGKVKTGQLEGYIKGKGKELATKNFLFTSKTGVNIDTLYEQFPNSEELMREMEGQDFHDSVISIIDGNKSKWAMVTALEIMQNEEAIDDERGRLINERGDDLDNYSYLDFEQAYKNGLITKDERDGIEQYIREADQEVLGQEESFAAYDAGTSEGTEEKGTGNEIINKIDVDEEIEYKKFEHDAELINQLEVIDATLKFLNDLSEIPDKVSIPDNRVSKNSISNLIGEENIIINSPQDLARVKDAVSRLKDGIIQEQQRRIDSPETGAITYGGKSYDTIDALKADLRKVKNMTRLPNPEDLPVMKAFEDVEAERKNPPSIPEQPEKQEDKKEEKATLTPIQQTELDKKLSEIDELIEAEKAKIVKLESGKRKELLKINNRNGLFGDIKGDPNDKMAGTFLVNQETVKKALKKFDEDIADANKEITRLEKLRKDTIESAGAQGEMEFGEEVPEPPKMAGDLLKPEEREVKPTEKIEDFGEKIGGARKDMEITRKVRDTDSLPAWRRKYSFARADGIVVLGEKVDTTKPFIAQSAKEVNGWGGKQTRYTTVTAIDSSKPKIFNSEDEAEAYIPIYEVWMQRFSVRKSGDKFAITKRSSTNKVVEYATFPTAEEAEVYMYSTEGATSLLNHKREDFSIPALDKVERTGKDWRNGRDISTEEFMSTFGFRGGEFGNWVKPEERRVMLNAAYDSFMDLADLLNVSPRALSLKGELSIAFGARGRMGAAAHFEPNRAVINLTRMNGAGSLAHEWAHAMDNYFGLQGAKKDYTRDEKGEVKAGRVMRTEAGLMSTQGMRKELSDLYDAIVKATQEKSVTRVMGTEEKQKVYDKQKNSVQREADDLIKKFENGVRRYQYNRKTKQREEVVIKATPEQIVKLKGILDTLITGKGTKPVWAHIPGSKAHLDYSNISPETIALDELYKEVFNKSGLKRDGNGFYNLGYFANKMYGAKEILDKALSGDTETLTVPTDYLKTSKIFDRSRAIPYWGTKVELFARAFEYFIEEKLLSQNQRADYLQYDKAPVYEAVYGIHPYPAGEERTILNESFDNFFKAIQTKEDDGNVIMFRRGSIANGLTMAEKIGSRIIAIQQKFHEKGFEIEFNEGVQITKEGEPVKNVPANLVNLANEFDDLAWFQQNARFRRGGTMGLYSNAEESLNLISQNKATPEQWTAMILNNGGKQAELDWMGWDEFVKDKKSLTKDEINEFIQANKVELQEVVLKEKTDDDINDLRAKRESLYTKISTTPAPEIDDLTKQLRELNDRFVKRTIDTDEYIQKRDVLEAERSAIANKVFSKEYAEIEKIDNEIKSTENSPKFSQYTLPGGSNYKEMLLTMPEKQEYTNETEFIKINDQWYDQRDAKEKLGIDDISGISALDKVNGYFIDGTRQVNKKTNENFKSSHFDQPNIVVHIRSNERVVDGKKVLYIEEFQSDFSQSLRKKQDEYYKLLETNPDMIIEMFKKSDKLEVLC